LGTAIFSNHPFTRAPSKGQAMFPGGHNIPGLAGVAQDGSFAASETACARGANRSVLPARPSTAGACLTAMSHDVRGGSIGATFHDYAPPRRCLIGRSLCRDLWASAGSPIYLRSASVKRSAAAFSPATKGWVVWWSIGAGAHVEHTVTQTSRSLGCSRARWSFASAPNSGLRPGDVIVIPGGTAHEAWFVLSRGFEPVRGAVAPDVIGASRHKWLRTPMYAADRRCSGL
jgi:hypothetical protein